MPLAGPAAFGKTAQLWPWLFIHWVRSRSQPATRHHRSGVLWRHFSCLHVIEGINYAHVEIADHSELEPNTDPDSDPARAGPDSQSARGLQSLCQQKLFLTATTTAAAKQPRSELWTRVRGWHEINWL